jgi:hypothetical protein
MVSSRELGLQGVSARPLAILPILPGSIATGSRSDTLPRQALAGILIAVASTSCDRSRIALLLRTDVRSDSSSNQQPPDKAKTHRV